MSEQEAGTHIPGEENLDASGAQLSPEERATAVGWYEKEGGLSAEDFLAKTTTLASYEVTLRS